VPRDVPQRSEVKVTPRSGRSAAGDDTHSR
jgi:hypothetical protein